MKNLLTFLLLSLTLSLSAENSELLGKLKESILQRFNEIHNKHSTAPSGIWYSNYLATLLNTRYQDLFSKDWTGYANDDYFDKTGNCIFQLRKGRSATEACQKLVDGITIMDCGNVTQLVYYLAISDVVGKEAFDAFVEKNPKPLFIATYTTDAPKNSILFDLLTEVQIPSPSKENERPLELCQLCYFRNYLSYLTKHPTGNAQGYNSIYLGYNEKGEQSYIAFWKSGPKTEKEVIALLNDRYNAPLDEWDEIYFSNHPEKKVEVKPDPNHIFFDDRNIFSYVINLEAVVQLAAKVASPVNI